MSEKKKVTKKQLEEMLEKLHTDKAKRDLVFKLSRFHTLPVQTVEDTAREYLERDEKDTARFLIDYAGPEQFPEICKELSDIALEEGDKSSAARFAGYAGEPEKESALYLEMCQSQKEKGGYIQAAEYAAKAGDVLTEIEMYIAWARDARDKIRKQESEGGFHGFDGAAARAVRSLDSLNYVLLPDGAMESLKDEFKSAAVRCKTKLAMHRISDCTFQNLMKSAVEIAKEYGKTDLLITTFEASGEYPMLSRIAEECGMEDLAELYKKMI